MKKKNGKNGGEVKGNAGEEKLSRRTAIKRIAAIFAGAAAGAKALGQQADDDMHLAQNKPFNPYYDAVYVPPTQRPYVRYSSFYTSYSSHKIYVPPPYSSRK
jgi:hypothetical protein